MARELKPCGTPAAYRRHREVPCADCCAAQAELQRQQRGEASVRGRYGIQGCGTNAGYHRHRKNGETPCRPCLDAMGTYQRQRAERAAA